MLSSSLRCPPVIASPNRFPPPNWLNRPLEHPELDARTSYLRATPPIEPKRNSKSSSNNVPFFPVRFMLTFILRQRGKRRAAIPILIVSHLNNTIVTATTVASVRLGYSASIPSTGTTTTALSYLSAPVKGVGLAIASDTLAITNTKDVPVLDERFPGSPSKRIGKGSHNQIRRQRVLYGY